MKDLLEILLGVVENNADAIGTFIIMWVVSLIKKKTDIKRISKKTNIPIDVLKDFVKRNGVVDKDK